MKLTVKIPDIFTDYNMYTHMHSLTFTYTYKKPFTLKVYLLGHYRQ